MIAECKPANAVRSLPSPPTIFGSPSVEMTDRALSTATPPPGSSPTVLRIRGPGDLKHLTDYVAAEYMEAYLLLEKQWEREPCLNTRDCEHVKKVRSQRRPLGAHRYLLLSLFLVVVFLRGCTYWGWNGVQDMLYKSGAFLWLCEPTSLDIVYQEVGDQLYMDCPPRKNAINDLYTAAFAANFIFSAAGGIILDKIGPKMTVLGAILVDAVGWALLAVASASVMSYVPALILIGMAADPGYFSLLCVANLFPKQESTVMGVMGSVRSLSFALPVIMAEVFKASSFSGASLWKVLLFYILVGLGICLFICVLFVPSKAFMGAEDFRREERKEQVTSLRKRILTSVPASFFKPWMDDTTLNNAPSTSATNANSNNNSSSTDRQYKLLLTKEEFEIVGATFVAVEKEEAKLQPEGTLRTCLLDARFLLLMPVFVVNLLRVEFYTKSNKEQLALPDGRNLYAFFSIMNILSFIPGPLMGYLSDRFGVCAVLACLNVAGMCMYALLMPLSLASRALSVVFFWLYASFVLSSIYCYIKTHFPNRVFGSLAGICSLVGGCFALTSIGWYRLSTEVLLSLKPKNFWPVDGVMIAGGGLVCCFVSALLFLDRKHKARKAQEILQKAQVTCSSNALALTSQTKEEEDAEGDGPWGTVEQLTEDDNV
ncbi:uncharacterized protein LOC34622516 [Cyclospora cayetanensis]|uniref:Uncharacterized protein LOC34622516 n=2 Tax=Cyclospora cayetanensis TaxID=88456 RepID=A0A6P5WD76_9EIME|nr:uncharacterized protein LOC34622516 [Cyclospora cayetanensis]OEH76811.1 major facilitator family protein [Cyclospora cayetanensis]